MTFKNPCRRRHLAAAIFSLLLALPHLAFGTGSAVARPEQLSFSLRTTEGGAISSQMLRGDVVVLAFGASWLPLSREQVKGVQELADRYAERDLRVYWVSTDSDSPKSKNYATDEQLRDFAKKNRLKIAVLRDPDGALFKRVGVPGNQLPAVVILDRTGSVHGEPVAGIDPKGDLVGRLSPSLNGLLGAQQ
jgi:peroxiredoxin